MTCIGINPPTKTTIPAPTDSAVAARGNTIAIGSNEIVGFSNSDVVGWLTWEADVAPRTSKYARRTIAKMKTLLAAAMLFSVVPLFAASYYPARLEDAKAMYLTRENFPVKGDGIADDTGVLQQAINQVQEKTNQGNISLSPSKLRRTHEIGWRSNGVHRR